MEKTDSRTDITCPIEHLEDKTKFLLVMAETLCKTHGEDAEETKEVFRQIRQYEEAIEILKEHQNC